MSVGKKIAFVLYIVLLLYLAGLGIDSAAKEEMLIQTALPFAAILIPAVKVLGRKSELPGWAVFTIWLGSAYLPIGKPVDYVAFLVYLNMAFVGVYKSPYILALAWLFHPVLDFIPRELPAMFKDLPVACIVFDIPIGLYILWNARNASWIPFENIKQKLSATSKD